jgi:GNAT superfamily N-acetyltransferase
MTLLDGPTPEATEVTVWDLAMTAPGRLRPGRRPDVEPVLLRAQRPVPELAAFFYRLVGRRWHWVDRLTWSDERWAAWCGRPELRLVTCWVDGLPAGYYELDDQGRSVEIVHLGLVETFFGCGLGGWLLTDALRTAWAVGGAERVWLHTCSLDGPTALANYRARGLDVVGQRTEWRDLRPGGGVAEPA